MLRGRLSCGKIDQVMRSLSVSWKDRETRQDPLRFDPTTATMRVNQLEVNWFGRSNFGIPNNNRARPDGNHAGCLQVSLALKF